MESGDQKPPKKPSTQYQLKKYLLLLATLVATVTYTAGLNLPGGVWQDKQSDHPPGDPILPEAHHRRYLAFYYCNATAFAASLVVCLLLLVLHEESTGRALVLLQAVMVLDLLGLMGAYVAGSCWDEFTTIYSSVLVSAVFAYVVLAFSNFVVSEYRRALPKKQDEDREEQHEALMLLATFAVTITYVAGLNPPGGFWVNSQDGHSVSGPVLQDQYSKRYQAFFVCNTTAFVASLLIIMLLLDKKLRRTFSIRFIFLYGFIAIALLGLVGAYTAGSSRERDNTTYVIGLAVIVLAYIFFQVAITNAIKSGIKDWRCCQVLTTVCNTASEPSIKRSPGRRQTQLDKEVEKTRDLVMLLATLVASITYQAGLDPPGGFWPDDRDGHKGGDPVLLTTHPTRYKVFFYSNSAAFVASLVVIMMVQSRFLLKRHTLEAAMLLDLFGLIGAYAAGSCRDVSTSIYVVALAGAVLVYVVIHIIFFTLDNRDNPLDAVELDKRREVLLLLAILAATLTYQAGLTPPGGFWSADDNSGHYAGFPVFLDIYPRRYMAFFYCNAASFMASIALILLLVNRNLYTPGIRCYAFYVCMVAGMFGLMGAYAAGSSRRLRTSIYVLTLVAAVFSVVALQVVIFLIRSRKKKPSEPTNPSYTQEDDSNMSSEQEGCDRENIFCAAGSSGHGSGSNASSEPVGRDIEIISCASGSRDIEIESSGSRDKYLREYLMLLGVLAASVTYQTGLKPPGGLWQDDNNGHYAGNSILHDINKRRYHAFFYSNSTSFMASVVVIVLLLPWTLHDYHLPLWPMHTAILLDMLGLLGAYAAGSARDWETSRNVISLLIPVLAYIAAYPAVSFFLKKRPCRKGNSGQREGGNANN